MNRPMNRLPLLVLLAASGALAAPTVNLGFFSLVDGQETVQTTSLLPGRTYTQRAVITTTRAETRARLTLPVPQGAQYAGGLRAPDGVNVTYSLDGQTFSPQPMLETTENGMRVVQPAPQGAYRSVRFEWPALKASATVTASFLFQVP